MDVKFLKSNRFWAVVITAFAFYLKQNELIGQAEVVLITTITAPFVAIRTIDRMGEKMEIKK